MSTFIEPECPGEHCPMCCGEVCNKCGAGCWNNGPTNCHHGSLERHEDADYSFIDLDLKSERWFV